MTTRISAYRARARSFLRTKTKHYIVMGLVALDVIVILADIFVALIACDLHLPKEGSWVQHTREGLHITATVFSGLFLVELVVAVWAFGVV
jgi:voltage-gated hydrogen channel 1